MKLYGQSNQSSKHGRVISPIRHSTAMDVLKNINRSMHNRIDINDYNDQPLFQQMEKNNIFKVQFKQNHTNKNANNPNNNYTIVKDSSGDIFIQQNYSKIQRKCPSQLDSPDSPQKYQKDVNIDYNQQRRNQSMNSNKMTHDNKNDSISLILKKGSIPHDNTLSKYIESESDQNAIKIQNNVQEQSDILDQIAYPNKTTFDNNNNRNMITGNRMNQNQTVPLQNLVDQQQFYLNENSIRKNVHQQNKYNFADSIRSIYQSNSVMTNELSGYSEPINLIHHDIKSSSRIDDYKGYQGLPTEESNSSPSRVNKSTTFGNQVSTKRIKSRSSTFDNNFHYLDSLQKYQESFLKTNQNNQPNIDIQFDKINLDSQRQQYIHNQEDNKHPNNQMERDTLTYASPVKKSIQLKRQQIEKEKEELSKLYQQYLSNAEQEQQSNQINKDGNYFVTSLKGKSYNINIISQIPKNSNSPTVEQELKTQVYLSSKEKKSLSPIKNQNIHLDRWK